MHQLHLGGRSEVRVVGSEEGVGTGGDYLIPAVTVTDDSTAVRPTSPSLYRRSMSVPDTSAVTGLPRVTISDFSSNTVNADPTRDQMIDALTPEESDSGFLMPSPSSYVTLEDVAPYKDMGPGNLNVLVPAQSYLSISSCGSSVHLNDDAWSYTNSSCGTSCETSDNPSSESSYEVKELHEDPEEKEPSDSRAAKKVRQEILHPFLNSVGGDFNGESLQRRVILWK